MEREGKEPEAPQANAAGSQQPTGEASQPPKAEKKKINGLSSFGEPYSPYKPEESGEERWYLNRAFIAAACIFAGVLIGKFVQDRPVRPTIAAAIQYQSDKDDIGVIPSAKPEDNGEVQEPLVKIPFRKLASAEDFDPLDPLKGGFPIPPKKVEEKLVSGGQVRVIPPADLRNLPGPMLEPLEGELPPFDPTSGETQASSASGPGKGLPNPSGGANPETVAVELDLPYAVGGASVPSADGVVGRLSAIASSNGGKARTFDHMGVGGGVDGKAVLLVVPIEKYSKAESAVRGIPGVSLDQSGRLKEGPRQTRLSAAFKTRLEDLQQKRKELLVDFLEASPVVKDIDVAIVAEARAVSSSRLGGEAGRQGAILVIIREG